MFFNKKLKNVLNKESFKSIENADKILHSEIKDAVSEAPSPKPSEPMPQSVPEQLHQAAQQTEQQSPQQKLEIRDSDDNQLERFKELTSDKLAQQQNQINTIADKMNELIAAINNLEQQLAGLKRQPQPEPLFDKEPEMPDEPAEEQQIELPVEEAEKRENKPIDRTGYSPDDIKDTVDDIFNFSGSKDGRMRRS